MPAARLKWPRIHPIARKLGILLACGWMAGSAWARDFRVNQVPNGNVSSCFTCHTSGGGTPRNAFGLDVFAITGFSNRAFWSASLAQEDSDGDGFTNGEELGDPDGDGTPTPGAQVTNPGNPSSKPTVNQPPQFTSSPVSEATIGLPYSYTATATDPENGQLAFSKLAGPDWLAVSPGGAVTGTPPEGSVGGFLVTLRVTDSGSPAMTSEQSYTLTVAAGFAAWQALHFNLPAEADLALPFADPDGDSLANLGEYAFRLNPRAIDAPSPILPTFGPGGDIVLEISVRDDDSKLEVFMEAAADVSYQGAQLGSVTVSDPTPGDGFETLRFADTVQAPQIGIQRFWRLTFQLQP